MITTEDVHAALEEQLQALQAARDAVRGCREGRVTNEERKAAMVRVEEADAKLRDAYVSIVRQAAKILDGEVVS